MNVLKVGVLGWAALALFIGAYVHSKSIGNHAYSTF